MKVLSVLALGDWQIDPTTRRLARGDETVRLSPKAMQVLLALGAAKGTVMSRTQLLDEVWPSVTVGEEVLTHAIAELRKALGDSTRNSEFVETVPKAGYRLLKPLTEEAIADPQAAEAREPDSPPEPAAPAELALGHEHKQVTVLDCALADALLLARTAGVEFMAETLERLHDLAREVIARHDGTVTEWTGDGFVALFGAP
ncbi:MAG TPA: winged helix-turn-helix domain-containing protein, partial [Afifellaceae bacterium]|nr:winged helix-turn-helix domain-containing protein [Afifellaceae bacterium]